ncbi:sugar transporter [Xylanimonas oleitrophica]|uniref:Sugar transporter n=1 Tax=Xylanimonas oleitrophica TaxID=2607479 RepID=A0A2W5XWX0_9MICO|nr:extracellular solute-binding protein [Xylanimonas oleitrophica]PZR55148.1 sugar transporter [Xylanimonas oleitrophica]
MKRNRLVATTVATTTTLALGLSACASGSTGTGTDGTSEGGAGDIRVWLVGSDTPDEAREYLKTTFEAENPGSTLTIEEQSWGGLVDKYTTALSGSDSPDLIEIGNTQAAAFTSAGAFEDLTDRYEELGGDDLLPSFVEDGTYDGKFYAAPYYSGARVVVYSKEVVGDTPVPTTWDEYVATVKAATTDTVSGLWTPGKDWRNGMTFVWANGGQIATQASDGTWEGGFSTPEGIKGLEQLQDVMLTANRAPADSDEQEPQVPFCAGQVAYLAAPAWVSGSIGADEDAEVPGCGSGIGSPENLSAFAAPGKTAGEAAPVLAGGSNIAIPMRSANKELAYEALKIMLSDEYQGLLAEAGLVPAKVSQADLMPDGVFAQASAAAAAEAISTPASPKWADVEASGVLEDSFVRLAQGGDVTEIAAALDAAIERTLNG